MQKTPTIRWSSVKSKRKKKTFVKLSGKWDVSVHVCGYLCLRAIFSNLKKKFFFWHVDIVQEHLKYLLSGIKGYILNTCQDSLREALGKVFSFLIFFEVQTYTLKIAYLCNEAQGLRSDPW